LFVFQEKVTDYAEEKEIVAASTALLDDAIATVRKLRPFSLPPSLSDLTPLSFNSTFSPANLRPVYCALLLDF
jgi:hypothetical protein